MSKYSIDSTTLTSVADAIRAKKGTSDTIQVSNFANEITNLPSGGGVEIDLPKIYPVLSASYIRSTSEKFTPYLASSNINEYLNAKAEGDIILKEMLKQGAEYYNIVIVIPYDTSYAPVVDTSLVNLIHSNIIDNCYLYVMKRYDDGSSGLRYSSDDVFLNGSVVTAGTYLKNPTSDYRMQHFTFGVVAKASNITEITLKKNTAPQTSGFRASDFNNAVLNSDGCILPYFIYPSPQLPGASWVISGQETAINFNFSTRGSMNNTSLSSLSVMGLVARVPVKKVFVADDDVYVASNLPFYSITY